MNYPFTAIVGQYKLKKALLLCAIHPGIGGLLIQGDKGTAKSTAARALAAVVPPLDKVKNCLFNCDLQKPAVICEVCRQAERELERVSVPFVNLPLGATEERILGSLDLEAVLVEKKKKFQPGLLASVHRGILYIDEVNLLPDHLVDVLLDVAAMGKNVIEREGLSLGHPSQFTLIGTMNPEEGQLRPQFLDRFGLMISVEAQDDIMERTEVVRRRIAFEKDPEVFAAQWEINQQDLRYQLQQAKELLPDVYLHDDLLTLISQMTTGVQVRSLRADIVMYKTAIAIAALGQRREVTAEDIREAAEFALGHRSKKNAWSSPKPDDNKPADEDTLDELMQNAASSTGQEKAPQNPAPQEKPAPQTKPDDVAPGLNHNGNAQPGNVPGPQQDMAEQIFAAGKPVLIPAIAGLNKPVVMPISGKQGTAPDMKKGLYLHPEPAKGTADIAVDATVIHAVFRNPEDIKITMADLQQKKRLGKTSNLILFLVDASGSMAANRRMEAVKGTVLHLLTDAYQKRDTVGVIAFRGIAAEVLLSPTQSVAQAEEAMKNLPTGGRTPLPHALQTAITLLNRYDKKSGYHPVVVFLTDGKANVALSAEGDPWAQTLELAAQFRQAAIQSLVLNTDTNFLNLNRAEELATAMGAEYLSLNDISEEKLTPLINRIL